MKYTVKRSKRKTLSLTVMRDGKAVVHAPMHISDAEIEAFVQQHSRWLAKKVAERTVPIPDFSDGSTVPVEGRVRTVRTGPPALERDTLYLPAEGREEAAVRLFRSLAKERMERLTREIASVYGYRYLSVSIHSTRSRWGSCNAHGKISYTFRSVFLPDDDAYYLAAHELAHTRVFHHGPLFWEEVSRVIPDVKKARASLKKYAWAMRIL